VEVVDNRGTRWIVCRGSEVRAWGTAVSDWNECSGFSVSFFKSMGGDVGRAPLRIVI
jgi:hypothetical protein